MQAIALKVKYALALVVSGILVAGPVLADKGGKHEGKDRHDEQRSEQRGEQRGEQRDGRRDDDRKAERREHRDFDADHRHFEDRHQMVVREYYGSQFRRGRCPPGLAKKHNGCMPPGQDRQWQMGQPLAREVVYYQVPQPLLVQIGPAPSGYRYVRVAGDILLIAIATGLVVDAIQDLGGR